MLSTLKVGRAHSLSDIGPWHWLMKQQGVLHLPTKFPGGLGRGGQPAQLTQYPYQA